MQRESLYLKVKPSQIATASFIFAYNLVTQNSALDHGQVLKVKE